MEDVDMEKLNAYAEKIQAEPHRQALDELGETIREAVQRFEDKTGASIGLLRGAPHEPVEDDMETMQGELIQLSW